MSQCDRADFFHGPLAIAVDQIVSLTTGESPLEEGRVFFVSKGRLEQVARGLKSNKKLSRLPGKKSPKETAYFYQNARALAACAIDLEIKTASPVIAVLFRDADGTASTGRGEWNDKFQSMLRGFEAESFHRGVPMIPKPKSEAWLICCFKSHPYQHCQGLEGRSGNDRSPAALKTELKNLLEGAATRVAILKKLETDKIDFTRIGMSSFEAFRARLEDVVRGGL
ncbi:MAG: hypothetical protein NT069_03990 [Planctomycetota bacterium]|nr:hypothetical protein [Planctomycetota bacterium]